MRVPISQQNNSQSHLDRPVIPTLRSSGHSRVATLAKTIQRLKYVAISLHTTENEKNRRKTDTIQYSRTLKTAAEFRPECPRANEARNLRSDALAHHDHKLAAAG